MTKGENRMKYMVIERFKPGKVEEVYRRYREQGRMLPPGLTYLNSWLAEDRTRCFQLMETERFELFEAWCARWNDLIEFEVVPVEDSPTQN